ncbi:Zinc carboxypeptidase [Pedobacter steynii]|uniref:Zinc carboxypeptidase n=1 Tax=Pedobacter steynii TaxID=430522 RepID=A0A1H0K2U8_9SPHI|nr:M14 metallopeptidase family protein [Pedobacter steynii]NQX43233.1 peptidase [Pedobacter steynii]SDO50199.1 Zinc carboxypeptidase [Pedobacter steynii]
MNRKCIWSAAVFLTIAYLSPVSGQVIPSPKSHFGFNIGDDYQLANYSQTEAYFKKLAAISDRVLLKEIGLTEENRKQYVLVISSPANLKKIERYKEISQKLARAEGLSDAAAAKLALEGKPVIWIDGGLHSTEMVATQQLIELYYKLLSANDPETMRILDKVVILLSQVNPDGQELLADWYMQEKEPGKRNMNVPRLYQKYIGHDNNRDFYMMNMKESANIARQQYIEWMPQIIYNHHQTAPSGAVVAGPPYRDPFNYVYDPLLITGIDGVAASMINRLNAENKPGYTRLSGSVYSTWWNGGLRTTPYFHNMIGILTEITGNPTPSTIPLVPDRLIPNNATPNPVKPQKWNFRQSIDYSLSLNYGILDYASRFGDQLLYNIYVMGRNAIQKGNQDNWTLSPRHTAAINAAYEKDKKDGLLKKDSTGKTAAEIPMKYYDAVYKNPALRDARGYIVPSDQSDFPTAVKFINALIKSGVQVQRAKSAFKIADKSYPAGSYIVKANQAFRPHVADMFEAQDHPNDFQYPGGPPVRPYDAAGWTLAFQMGVKFDRILTAVDGPFEKIEYGVLQSPPVYKLTASKGYLLSAAQNNSFIAVNDLLKAGIEVSRLTKPEGNMPAGSFYVPEKGMEILIKSGISFGTTALQTKHKPKGMLKITPGRIALFDQYGGSMPSGWVRWILEQFHFSFQLIYPQDIDNGMLHSKYDKILFISGGIPAPTNKAVPAKGKAAKRDEVPEAFRPWQGSITPDKSIPQLKDFLEQGGDIVTVGSSTNLAYQLGLPVQNALTETKADGKEAPLPGDKFYIPGSILKAGIAGNQNSNWGMPEEVDMVFNNSPVFKLGKEAEEQGIKPLAWFGKDDALRSGWAWGQAYLKDGVIAFVAPVGKGKLYAFGTEITFRAQAHSTFKMLFNELYLYK